MNDATKRFADLLWQQVCRIEADETIGGNSTPQNAYIYGVSHTRDRVGEIILETIRRTENVHA